VTDVIAHLQARLLSTVVTRVIKAPSVSLTEREVAEPEVVMVPTRHGSLRCYITRAAPDAPLARSAGLPPVYVNIHGGAFLIGAPQQDDHLVRSIAGEVGATVVNIDYSTAPKASYPRAHEECFDVLQWVKSSGETNGWDSQRVAVGGGSAGGNLALGAIELARQAGSPSLRAAVVVVPIVDQTVPAANYISPLGRTPGRGERPFVNPRLIRAMSATYFRDVSRRAEGLASPALLEDELAVLPPLLVLAAERDSLRPQIERFVEKAREKGASVTYHCFSGVDHGFPVMAKKRPDNDALRELSQRMKDHLLVHLA
jgi:acetyl esterase